MKKITIRILTLILLLSLLCVPVFAAETWGSMNVSADDVEVTLGEEVVLTVYLGDCSALEGGVKNYKATVTIPEGLTLVSATVDASFDAATGMISSTAATSGNVVTISSLGNITGSYTGQKIAVAKIVCKADAVGTYSIGFTASLTDNKYATQTPAAGGATVTVVAPVHNHSFGAWKQTTAPSCTEPGVETRECACGEKETREVAATGHSFGEWKVTKAATCTEKGEETRECACGEKETREVTATGHSFGEWKVTKAATCTEKGEETRECACGEKETREISVVDHALNTYGKDSTHHWALCDNCDYVGEKEAHSYDYNGVCVCGATKPVEEDPDLDDVPQTGDITPYITMTFVAILTLAATAVFVLKRKAVK